MEKIPEIQVMNRKCEGLMEKVKEEYYSYLYHKNSLGNWATRCPEICVSDYVEVTKADCQQLHCPSFSVFEK